MKEIPNESEKESKESFKQKILCQMLEVKEDGWGKSDIEFVMQRWL